MAHVNEIATGGKSEASRAGVCLVQITGKRNENRTRKYEDEFSGDLFFAACEKSIAVPASEWHRERYGIIESRRNR